MSVSAIGNSSNYSSFYGFDSHDDKSNTDLTTDLKIASNESKNSDKDAAETKELSNEEKAEVKELKQRDQEVRSHEMAHIGAGGQYVRGGASFEYQSGPDGHKYAVGGEVSIDTSKVSGDPDATIRKMQTIRKAALAPAQPSGQDRSVAAQASQVETQARQEKVQKKDEEQVETNESPSSKKSEKTNSYTNSGTAVESSTPKTSTFEIYG